MGLGTLDTGELKAHDRIRLESHRPAQETLLLYVLLSSLGFGFQSLALSLEHSKYPKHWT